MPITPQDGLEGLESRAGQHVGTGVDSPVHEAAKLVWGGAGLPLSSSRQNGLVRIIFIAKS